jgi:hypothetical protein
MQLSTSNSFSNILRRMYIGINTFICSYLLT